MSTKTTLKRVALVAVSALGFGLMSSIAPATAATSKTSMNVTDISFATDKAPVAGTNGTSSVHTITFTTNSSTATVVNAFAVLSSSPATSAMAQESEDGSISAKGKWQMASSTPATDHDAVAKTITTGTAFDTQGADVTAATGTNAAGNYYHTFYIHAWYDVPGTYVWSIRDESTNGSTTCSGIDYCETFTVVVSGASSGVAVTGALSAFNSSSVIESTNAGSIVKVTLTDASGNAVQPDALSGVTIDPSGTGTIYAVNGTTTSAAAGAAWSLGAGDFNGSGVAYVNITNATAESISVSLTNNGFSSFTAPSAITLTFRDATILSTTAAPRSTANGGSNLDGTATPYYYDATAGSKTTTWSLGSIAAASTDYDYVTVVDSTGYITGLAGLKYALAIARVSSSKAGQFSVTTTATSGSYTFSVNATTGTGITATAATRATDSVTVTADNRKVLTGTTNSFTVLVEDQFGNPRGAQTVTASIAGRNSTVSVASAATDADGYATLSYKDASTSTTSMTDTITFTSGTVTDTALVTYAASLGVATVLLTTPHTTSTGVTEAVMTYTDIEAGDGAETATGATVTATVKDSAGVLLSYVPVTFTVSGTGAAVLSTKQTVYTSLAGTASATVYGWLAGTYTVTATAGGVSDDAPVNFAQVTADGVEARNITATVSGNTVVATVKDRFGNPVYDAPVRATRTGAGSFNGVSTASGDTNRDGVIEFVISGGSASVTVYVGTTADYGQTDAVKGNVDGTAATSALTAYTAGTALEAEEGVGASYDAAGNNSATVSVTVVDAAVTAAEAATDAAAEAIDAANAATDAANLAAEAADAATVAAEEARDAADAATAAVEELATQVATLMAALKAQITTLANTVAKIAKKVKA